MNNKDFYKLSTMKEILKIRQNLTDLATIKVFQKKILIWAHNIVDLSLHLY